MGYRLRIGKISKIAHEKYKDLETEEDVRRVAGLSEGEGVYRCLPEYTELYEIGKYVDHSVNTIPFFKFDLPENDFSIASREWLLDLIEQYRVKIHAWYDFLNQAIIEKRIPKGCSVPSECKTINGAMYSLNKEFVEDSAYGPHSPVAELYGQIEKRVTLWSEKFVKPYVLEEDSKELTNDWSYEYAIFNLLHILHTFDWENDYMIYSGW